MPDVKQIHLAVEQGVFQDWLENVLTLVATGQDLLKELKDAHVEVEALEDFEDVLGFFVPAEAKEAAQESEDEVEEVDEFYDGPITGFRDDPAFEKDIPAGFVGVTCREDLDLDDDDDSDLEDGSDLEDEDEFDSELDGEETGFAAPKSYFGEY